MSDPEDTAPIAVPAALRRAPDDPPEPPEPPRVSVEALLKAARDAALRQPTPLLPPAQPRPFRPTVGTVAIADALLRAQELAEGPPPTGVRFPEQGTTLRSHRGEYLVTRALGRGAYGAVYEAVGPFDQRYALKLIVPANRPYAEVQAEWSREAERLLRLRHPNVVYMHDAFESDHLFYMALEYCTCSLRDRLRGPFFPELAIEVARQVLAAVQYLHDGDLVHGDLHAGNVLLVEGGERPAVKLTDFGISLELQGRAFVRPGVVHHGIMAPEVAVAGYASRQSDLYQLGLLLFHMVTGAPALDERVPYDELLRQVHDGAPRARAEALGTPLGAVMSKLLRRREAYRYASAREVWDDLRRVPEWQAAMRRG
ncbi:MAG: serine/threonine protein kinase [Polyangiaceae bacterium]|nr:serine/threonine protein kinase [Polyangiaceae bacterium]